MITITLQEAQNGLADLIHRLPVGEWVVLTENDKPVAQLIVPFVFVRQTPPAMPTTTGTPQAGRIPGLVVPDDFKEPLEEMQRISWPCQAGTAKDKILWIAPDFDAPLEDFQEYME